MRDETTPWVDAVDRATASGVDRRVLAGTTIWLVAFGWYVLLQADPRPGLDLADAALVYGLATLTAGIGFGWGEEQIRDILARVLDRTSLTLGGVAIATTGLLWFLFSPHPAPYETGLWLGIVLLGAGILLGASMGTD